MSPRAKARLLIVLAALFWSTNGLILKSLPEVHWLAITGMRALFASLLFLPGAGRMRVPLPKLLLAILLYALLTSTLMGSMQLGTAAQGIWLQYIAPAVLALWAYFVSRQRLRSYEIAAVILTTIAIVVIAGGGGSADQEKSLILGLISGVGFAFFVLVLKTLDTLPPASIHLWLNLGAAALLLSAAVALHISLPTAPRELLLLAVMGMGQLALGYYCFQSAIAGASAVEASIILLLEPILNPIWVYLVHGEIPTPRVMLGCGIIAVALIIFALGPVWRDAAKIEPPA